VLPPLTPLTSPDDGSTVATPVLPLLQVPPAAPSVSCVVDDWHTVVTPFILPGIGVTVTFTVIVVVALPLLTCITNASLPE